MTQVQANVLGQAGGRTSRGSVAARVGATLVMWQQRVSERAALASLDDRFLKDMGLTRADAEREYGKPFWRA